MDWNHPERVFGSGLEGPVLRSLWRAGTPLTGAQVHRVAQVGTPTGVRYALVRLAAQGIVTGTRVGAAVLYDVNRAHLAYPAVSAAFEILDPWDELSARTSAVIETYYPTLELEVAVAAFGSVARGDAALDSDLDLLVVTPTLDETSHTFADDLAQQARTWTGQEVQIYLTTGSQLAEARRAGDPIIETFRRDARRIAGRDITPLLAPSS